MKNILFSGNNKVFDGVVTCMLSIFKRSTSEEPICFHIMTMDVSHLREDFIPISDEQIEFIDASPVEKNIYYPKFLDRDTTARKTYGQEIRRRKSYQDDIFVMDILREELRNDDPRIQRIISK